MNLTDEMCFVVSGLRHFGLRNVNFWRKFDLEGNDPLLALPDAVARAADVVSCKDSTLILTKGSSMNDVKYFVIFLTPRLNTKANSNVDYIKRFSFSFFDNIKIAKAAYILG